MDKASNPNKLCSSEMEDQCRHRAARQLLRAQRNERWKQTAVERVSQDSKSLNYYHSSQDTCQNTRNVNHNALRVTTACCRINLSSHANNTTPPSPTLPHPEGTLKHWENSFRTVETAPQSRASSASQPLERTPVMWQHDVFPRKAAPSRLETLQSKHERRQKWSTHQNDTH